MSKRDIHFVEEGWTRYLYWQKTDRKTVHKINSLLLETQRDPFSGIGKPEALRGNRAGYWSRRINKEHRLVYRVTDTAIRIISCRFHYDGKKT
jgi:toxin YoeB